MKIFMRVKLKKRERERMQLAEVANGEVKNGRTREKREIARGGGVGKIG